MSALRVQFLVVCLVYFLAALDSNVSTSPVSVPEEPRPTSPSFKNVAKSARTKRRLDPKTNSFKPIGKKNSRHGFNVGSERWNIASKPPAKGYSVISSKQALDQKNEALKKIINEGDPCKIVEEGADKNCVMAVGAYVALVEEGKGCRLAESPDPQCRPLGGDTVCSVKPSPSPSPGPTGKPKKVTALEVWMKCRAEKFFSLADCVAQIEGSLKLKWD